MMTRIVAITLVTIIICYCTLSGCQPARTDELCTSCDCGTGTNNDTKHEEAIDYKIIDSGRCSENVQWEIRSNGMLYIYGSGPIPNYEYQKVDGTIAPWRASAVSSQITDVIVSDGITGIGKHAFDGLNLSTIYFGHDVITFNSGSSFSIRTAYIPASMQDIHWFLYNTRSYYGSITITIYYEGTEEEWKAITRNNNVDISKYIIFYDYTY